LVQNFIAQVFDGISRCNRNLCGIGGANYLEIGCWKGSTLFSALYKNKIENSYVIDNFSQYKSPRKEFLASKQKYNPETVFFDEDCFKTDLKKIPHKIDIYFYDGNHNIQLQYDAFYYFDKILNDTFLMVIDDYNDGQIPVASRDAIEDLGYEVLYQKELFTPGKKNADKSSWWNGIGIFLLKKTGKPKKERRIYPQKKK